MTTLVLAEPFETGDSLSASATGGTFSVQNTTKHSATYGLEQNPSGAASTWRGRGRAATGALADWGLDSAYASVVFQYATLSASVPPTFTFVNSALAVLAFWRVNANGAVQLFYTNGSDATTSIGTSATLLTAGTKYVIGCKVLNVASAGGASVELTINGVVAVSASSLTIRSSGRTIDQMLFGSGSSLTYDWFFDDLMVASDGYPGECWTQVLHPTSDATNTFTSGTFADLDEMDGATNDGDTSFAGDATSGHVLTCNFEALSGRAAGGQILAVVANMVVRDEGGASSLNGRLVSGATTDNWTAADPGSTYVLRQKIYTTDPNTGAAWTVAAVNAIKFGLANAASVAIRCTALALWVVYKQDALLVDGGLVNRGLVNGGLVD